MLPRRLLLPLVLLAMAAGLAACADDPSLLKADTSGVTIRLGDGDDAMAEAVEIANRHCVNVRRLAVLQTVATVEGSRLAFFDCVRV